MENLLARKNVNKNGGNYLNGKPLDLERRREIIERFKNGEKVNAIAVKLKITHGVVSKITRHYNQTGSYLPKKRSNPSEKKAAKRKAIKFGVDTILEGTTPDSRRIRNLFAPEQIKVLESYFAVNPYLNADIKKEIREKTKLTDKEITTWFTNKRCRLRKQLLDTSSSSTSSATSATSESSLTSQSSNSDSSSSNLSSFYSPQNVLAVPEHIPSALFF
uniref:Uncharacterized protein n=1 Tax=Panagrolaimus sp. PS1159 TaxID=55785 RepID=A0AC35G854_9BILA